MIIGIYQSLIIHIIFVFHDVDSLSIKIEGNVSGILGENGTEIECSYARETVRSITRVDIKAFNRSSEAFEQIAGYLTDDISKLLPQGQYLKGRVTLMSLTQSSTKAVMIFNKLMCIDDTFYKCSVTYTDSSLLSHTDTSSNMSIQVQVTPSKPDKIYWMKVSVDSSSTTPTVPMSPTTSSSSTEVTTKVNETFTTLDSDEQNDTTASSHSTLPATSHKTTSFSTLDEDLSTNSSYRTTTYSIPQTTTAPVIAKGDNITVFCAGDVGKPPAKHIFEKYLNGKIVPMQDTAIITSISEMSEKCSYYRTSNLTFQVTANDNNAVIRCVVNSSMAEPDMYVETQPIEVYSHTASITFKHSSILADISTTQSTSTGSSSGAYDKKEQSTQSLGPVIGGVAGAAVLVIVMIIVIVYIRKKRTSEKPTIEKEPKSFVNFTSKPIAESRKGDYADIALEEDTNKRRTVDKGHEVDDIREHNKEYLKKQKEEEQKMNESNTSPQPAVYAQVNEATKSKNKQNTETLEFVDQQEDGKYAEPQEGIYDKSGDRRHKLNENDEHYDTSTVLSTQNSNGDTKSFKQNSQVGSYNNQTFEKDDNRKVATVSPTIRSSGGLQDDEQTNQNRQSQSKKEYENVMGKDQTDTSEGDSSHRTAL